MAIPHNLKKGVILRVEGQPYVVLDYWEARTAQRRGTLHVKLRDVKRGKVVERTLDDRSEADVMDSSTRVLQYLYSDPGAYHFMDVRTYDQIAIPAEVVGDSAPFLVEETEYRALFLDEQPVVVEIPPAIVLEVVETPPSAGTASGNTYKAAKLKGGMEVSVPRFVKSGDRIRISTETREYLGKESE
jgi:elongation factor P